MLQIYFLIKASTAFRGGIFCKFASLLIEFENERAQKDES